MIKFISFYLGKRKFRKELELQEKFNRTIEMAKMLAPAILEIIKENQKKPTLGEYAGRLYDFYLGYKSEMADELEGFNSSNGIDFTANENKNRIEKKPVDVMHELQTVPTPFNTTDEYLQNKIDSLSDKSKLVNHRFTKQQIEGLQKRLENRKKYPDHYNFFGQFPNTTDEKIDELLSKYKLVIKPSHLFVPTFPNEAIEIMKEYTKITLEVSGEEPVFYVIAEEKDFQSKDEKLDPILLVQSPFGFYWQILGAWDKEMLLLSEL